QQDVTRSVFTGEFAGAHGSAVVENEPDARLEIELREAAQRHRRDGGVHEAHRHSIQTSATGPRIHPFASSIERRLYRNSNIFPSCGWLHETFIVEIGPIFNRSIFVAVIRASMKFLSRVIAVT